MPDYLNKRNGYWQFARRVPKDYAKLDPSGVVKLSTNIAIAEDRRGIRAKKIAEAMNRALRGYWTELREGSTREAAAERFDEAIRRARAGGVEHHESELAAKPIADRLDRLEALMVEMLKLMKERLKK